MSVFNDAILKQMYLEYAVPCDRIVSDPARLARFARDYRDRSGQDVDLASLGHHLLNLRRIGQAKGGLPRLRRAYNGRN